MRLFSIPTPTLIYFFFSRESSPAKGLYVETLGGSDPDVGPSDQSATECLECSFSWQ
jgi:hypothetical protein